MDVMNRFDVLEDNDNCLSLYQLTELHNNIIKKNAEAKTEKKRNWGDMPEDILSIILMKLGAIGILFRAQSVCSAWRKLSKDPQFFRYINLCENQWDFLFQSLGRNLLHYSELQSCIQVRKIVLEAVHRSCGQLEELVIDDFCPDAILHFILDRSHSLKCLRIFDRRISSKEKVQLIRKVPFLEELELCSPYWYYFIKEVGKLCSHIKCLRYTSCSSYYWQDEIAVEIADKMPQLGRLHLSGIKLTDIGLQALLDGCRDLEYLDLAEYCADANIGEELRKECQARIKCLVLPVNRIGGSDEDSSQHGLDYWSYWSGYDESYDSEDLYDVDDVEDTLLFPKKLVAFYR